jgi:hypothetical protein
MILSDDTAARVRTCIDFFRADWFDSNIESIRILIQHPLLKNVNIRAYVTKYIPKAPHFATGTDTINSVK